MPRDRKETAAREAEGRPEPCSLSAAGTAQSGAWGFSPRRPRALSSHPLEILRLACGPEMAEPLLAKTHTLWAPCQEDPHPLS